MRSLRRFGSLSREDRRLVVEAAVWLAIARLMMALMPFARIAHHVGLRRVELEPVTEGVQGAARIGWAVRAVAGRSRGIGTCLARSLACSLMLRRRGIDSTLTLGVAKDDPGGIAAHAWTAVGEEILTGQSGMERFTPLSAFTTASVPARSRAERWTNREAAARALLLQAELVRVTKAFADAAIPLVVFKGVPLALRAYGNVAGRAFGDNDVLVRQADVDRAFALLESLDYVPCRQLETARRWTNQIRMRSGGADLELHWSPFNEILFPVPEDVVWSRTEVFEHGELRCLVFDPCLTLVHLAYHHAIHRFEWPKILEDTAAAWNTWHSVIDPAQLADVARRTRQSTALVIALTQAQEAGLLMTPPPDVRSRRAAFVLGLHDRRIGRTTQGRLAANLALARPDRAVRKLAHALFPPADTIELVYGDAPSKARRILRPIELAVGFTVGTLVSRASSRAPSDIGRTA